MSTVALTQIPFESMITNVWLSSTVIVDGALLIVNCAFKTFVFPNLSVKVAFATYSPVFDCSLFS